MEINNTNKSITVCKGDSGSIDVACSRNISSSETLSFTVKKKPNDTTAKITKNINGNGTKNITIPLTKTDTNLDVDNYKYSIRIISGNNCETPIAAAYFIVKETIGGNNV